MDDNNVIFECRGLTKKYGSFEALSDVNLKLEKGRIVGLLGPNGSGKSTLIKLANGLLSPTRGEVLVSGMEIGTETKRIVSYLPEKTYLNNWMKVREIIDYFEDFYTDFSRERAHELLQRLNINPEDKLKTMSKGTKEKVQLILVMSRNASLYLLDEPIGGVDPAARDYIINTIITNYNPESTVVISTHLITDVEQILDEVVFIEKGKIIMQKSVDEIRQTEGKSVDALFREVFRC
ncbi:ABC transporter ATP-binding protein [Parasporobacterium paucivorans]|uniref:ABC-2 type transport system ATP-binding protein n=1 Tax=Parasporobacterium paucivorans DSM 15970 TaxID=1122934 RepID=A0A1M6LNZ8_9FIRM|nr:ABC transporter ATP-binding protein [Parasporobacterium paucivorans]SHJ72947.1 ABC-2 type transport system ATP-binding protein [Parasporobacterium paucivorans DSM 15970]